MRDPVARGRDLALFLLLGALWGGSFPAIKLGLAYLPPVAFAAIRYLVGATVVLGYAAATADYWLPRARADWLGLLVGGVLLIAGNGLLFVGQQFVPSGVAAIIFSLIPILTIAVGWGLLPDERVQRYGLLGVIVGLAGVWLIVRPDPQNVLASTAVGKALILASTVGAATGSVLLRRLSPPLGNAALTGWSMVVGSLILTVAAVAVGDSTDVGVLPLRALAAIGYLAVPATGIGFLIYFHLLTVRGPLEANLVSYIVPIVATAVGWALLGESITRLTFVGFLVIFAGFALLRGRNLVALARR